MSLFPHRFRLEAALLGTIVVWGTNFSVFKIALRHFHPLTANVVRFIVALVVLAIAYRLQATNAWPRLWANVRAYGGRLFVLSLLGYVLYQLCFVLGIARTSAGSAALIMASAPLWTALVARISGVERLRGAQWIGLLVSLAGTALVVLGSARAPSGVDSLVGNLLMLGSALLWAGYTVYSKPLLAHVDATTVTLVEIAMAFPILIVIALPVMETTAWNAVTWTDIGALVYSGGLSIGLTIVVWNSAVRQVGPAGTAVYANLTPFVAVISGYFLLGEPITLWQVAGGVILITGLVMMRRAKRRADAVPSLPING